MVPYWWESETVVSNPENYITCAPLIGPNGDQTISVSNNPEISIGELVFFNGVENVEVLLAYFDRYYDPYFSAQINYGPVGIVYEEELDESGMLVQKELTGDVTADELRLQNAPLGIIYLSDYAWEHVVHMEPRAQLRLERLEAYATPYVDEGVKATGELNQGAHVFSITDPGTTDGDIALVKTGVPLEAATYRVKVWAKSSSDTYAHLLARDEASTDGSFLGGGYNLPIGTAISPLEMEFTSDGKGTAELMLNLGRITPNPDNPQDTTPSDFTVTIDKIELYKITGEQTQTPVYTADFSAADSIAVNAGDGASATATAANGSGTFQIDAYPTEGGVWSIKADMALPGVTLNAGEKYYYSFTIQAENAQSAECLVESASQADAARANFNSIALNAGEQVVVSNVFEAEAAVEDPVIWLQLGSPSEGVTSNKITVTNLEFGTVSGDLNTEKTLDYFGQSIATDASADLLWTVYNGTDEDNDTGAGDTFCACVLNFVLNHGLDGLTEDDLTRMLHFANTAAYLVTTRKGAIRSMPTPEQVLELM